MWLSFLFAMIEISRKCLYFFRMSTGANSAFQGLRPFWISSMVLYASLNSLLIILRVVLETKCEVFMAGDTGVMMVISVLSLSNKDSSSRITGISHVHLEQMQKNRERILRGEQLGYSSMIFARSTVQPMPPRYENICRQTPLLRAHILMALRVILNTYWFLILVSRQEAMRHPLMFFLSLSSTTSRTGLSNSRFSTRRPSGIWLIKISKWTPYSFSLMSGNSAVGMGYSSVMLGLVASWVAKSSKKCLSLSTQGGTMQTASMSLSLLLTPSLQLPKISNPHLSLTLGLIPKSHFFTATCNSPNAFSFKLLEVSVSLQPISRILCRVWKS